MRNERKREAWRLTLHSGGVVQYGCCLGFEELCISYQIIILPFPACLDSIRVASDLPVLVKLYFNYIFVPLSFLILLFNSLQYFLWSLNKTYTTKI